MFEYDGIQPLPIKAGDEIVVLDDIRRGSVICFHRQSDHMIHIRTLSPEGIANYPGPKFVVDVGNSPGTLRVEVFEESTR